MILYEGPDPLLMPQWIWCECQGVARTPLVGSGVKNRSYRCMADVSQCSFEIGLAPRKEIYSRCGYRGTKNNSDQPMWRSIYQAIDLVPASIGSFWLLRNHILYSLQRSFLVTDLDDILVLLPTAKLLASVLNALGDLR